MNSSVTTLLNTTGVVHRVSIDVPLHHPHVMIFKASLSRFLSSCVELSGACASGLAAHAHAWRVANVARGPAPHACT